MTEPQQPEPDPKEVPLDPVAPKRRRLIDIPDRDLPNHPDIKPNIHAAVKPNIHAAEVSRFPSTALRALSAVVCVWALAATTFGLVLNGEIKLARDAESSSAKALADLEQRLSDAQTTVEHLRTSPPCETGTFKDCSCEEKQPGRSTCRNGNFGPCVCQSFAVEPTPAECGEMPRFESGFAQVRLAVGTRSQVTEKRNQFLAGLKTVKDGSDYYPTLAIVDGLAPDGSQASILLINNADEKLASGLCQWLTCKGWNPGKAACEMRILPSVAPPSKEDTDKDGIPDPIDKCPLLKEDGRPPNPKDGCPDADEDGIPDPQDRCQGQKEDGQVPDPKDGCPSPCWDQAGYNGCMNACNAHCEADGCKGNAGCEGAWCGNGEARIGCHRSCEGRKNLAIQAKCWKD